MGTRGIWGFRYKNKDKLTYNHFDSYPTGLGNDIKKFISSHSVSELKKIATKIQLVDPKSEPTKKQIKECEAYTNLSVSERDTKDWYCLLRETQSKPEAYITKLKYMIDNQKFIKDSLFCEYGYIINLDTNMLELYVGFQNKPQNNRYKPTQKEIKKEKERSKKGCGTKYYNCKLLMEIPLTKVPTTSMEEIESKLSED